MANSEQLEILGQGVEEWNKWRKQNPKTDADLSRANLTTVDLGRANLSDANLDRGYLAFADLRGANLTHARLKDADLTHADLTGVNLARASLFGATLAGANLSGANLSEADLGSSDLRRAKLSHTNLRSAHLLETNFSHADLRGADISSAIFGFTGFADVDLSEVNRLDSVQHIGPSTIGIDTLYKSGGKIPETFLRGCGAPDDFITFIPSLFGAQQAIQFYSCFISYSSNDEDFARRLYSRMRDEHLRVWFAPEDIKGGEKLHEQLERAIQMNDRLLIIISGHSMQSEWVMTEIRKARRQEIQQKRRNLFPIRLESIDAIREWECFDADTGKDLAVEIREYFIPDFSNWKEHDEFEASFERLLKDLRAV